MNDQCSVLVAEDIGVLAREVRFQLERIGISVVGPARTVQEALRLAVRRELDAAVLDVDLRGERIEPVARRLAERDIPFVFMTGFESPGLPTEMSDHPILFKPLDYDQLRQTLLDVMHGGPARAR